MKNGEDEKTSVKSKKYYVFGFLMILAIGFVHFAAQMFFIQTENLQSIETAAEIAPPVEPISDGRLAVDYESQQTEVAPTSEIIKTDIRRQPKISLQTEIVPARVPVKRKASAESRAERLRRVERILTGI